MKIAKAAKLKKQYRHKEVAVAFAVNHAPLSYWQNGGGGMKASDALKRAAEMVDGSRQVEHGDKAKSFKHIAEMWSAFLGFKITAEQVCHCMTLLKIGRTQHGTPTEDHYTDAAGYAAIAGELRLNGVS